MKPFLRFFLIVTSAYCLAQKTCIYEFKNTLNETSNQGPVLTTLGSAGTFVEESLPELGGMKRLVYTFKKNCGLSYDMTKSVLNLRGSYSIEMYFKFDALESWKRVIDFKNRTSDNGAYIFNGKLNFYNIVTSDIAPVAAGEYTHYTFTYNASTRQVNIYADGIGKISFTDSQNDAVIDARELHFFYDDLKVNNEASSGTVAYIKFFDYVVSPEEAKKNFGDIEKTVKGQEQKATPEVSNNRLVLKIVNAKTLASTPGSIVISDKHTGKQIKSITSKGSSEIELPKGAYKISVQAKNFASTTDEAIIEASTVTKEIRLTPIQIGEQMQLENVHFKQGTPDLLPESYAVLDKLVKMLNDNSNMEIELSGHTDNQGNPKDNVDLSEKRVATISNYLVSKGINAKRVKGKGYGGTRPIAPNDKEETRKLNRRVDFKIVKM